MQEDNIEIEKTYDEDGFFGARIFCSSNTVTATTETYIVEEKLKELHNQLDMFLHGDRKEQHWESGPRRTGTAKCVAFTFSYADKLGHIRIEVFMELSEWENGGSPDTHICCFYVYTELGLLLRFSERLPELLKKNNIGYIVSLNGNV